MCFLLQPAVSLAGRRVLGVEERRKVLELQHQRTVPVYGQLCLGLREARGDLSDLSSYFTYFLWVSGTVGRRR